MAYKAKILSFAKAKDASRKRSAQSSTSSRSSSRFVSSSASSSSSSSGSASRSLLNAARSTRSASSNRSPYSTHQTSTTTSRRSSSRSRSFSQDFERLEELERAQDIEETEDEYGLVSSRSQNSRDKRKKKRAKAKADRMYSRQFAGDDSVALDDAPRAALYKGQMGAKQKKAAKMQGSFPRVSLPSLPTFSAAGLVREKASGLVAHTSLTPLSLKVLTAVTCLILMCAFLYAPAQQYYHSQRENARLMVEYQSIESRNNALDVQNDIMVSDAGIEDSVRQRFGYIKEGESLGIVVGLSEEATNSLRDSEKIEASVLSSTVKAPEEWYTPLLDALFGVE